MSMKHIVLMLTLLWITATPVAARELWKGSCSLSGYAVKEGKQPSALATEFKDAKAGHKLVVDVASYGDDAWHAVELWCNDVSIGSVQVTPDTKKVSFNLSERMLKKLRKNGFFLAGTGYTATAVNLVDFDGVFWEGESRIPTWGAAEPQVMLEGKAFAGAKVGDTLAFDVAPIDPSAWSGVHILNYEALPCSWGQTTVTPVTKQVTYTLTEPLLKELQRDGIKVDGSNLLLTKIALR